MKQEVIKVRHTVLYRFYKTKVSAIEVWGHPFSTYAKFSEKLTFLTPWYAYVRVRIRGNKMLFFGKFCVHTKWMNPAMKIKSRNSENFQSTFPFFFCYYKNKTIEKHSFIHLHERVLSYYIFKFLRGAISDLFRILSFIYNGFFC